MTTADTQSSRTSTTQDVVGDNTPGSTTRIKVDNVALSPQRFEQELANTPPDIQEKLRAMLERMSVAPVEESVLRSKPKSMPKSMRDHEFWKTQPVVGHDEVIQEEGPIIQDKPADQIRQTPWDLPPSSTDNTVSDFEWSEIDMEDDTQLDELYTLLNENYIEDDDASFRFHYSKEFLKWDLTPPGWRKEWLVGVRVVGTKELVAFISWAPQMIRLSTTTKTMAEVNYLCVHKRLRSRRLAPILIKEITRLNQINGIFQAVFTAGVVLPTPMATARYFHRSLNPKKLVQLGFSKLGSDMTLEKLIKVYALDHEGEARTAGLRVMVDKDVPAVTKLLNAYLGHFTMVPWFEEEDVRHWMVGHPGIVWAYVVEDEASKEITDFFSFYSLPSTVLNNPHHTTLRAAYSFYYAVKTPRSLPETLSQILDPSEREDVRAEAIRDRLNGLMEDALVLAKELGFDVFNALDLMDNDLFLEDLQFGPGDGYLHYYIYNYKARTVDSEKMGLIMV